MSHGASCRNAGDARREAFRIAMTHLDVFDPPMCCSSGVCGASVDPLLAAFAADVDWLTSQGVSVKRYNLAQDPQAFVAHPLGESGKADRSVGTSVSRPT